MTTRRVLISGASIAGPALAFWLHRAGIETTIVERAPELRRGGQNVDVRGAGREVARRMGIEDEVRAATTGEAGVRFVDARDRVKAAFPAGTSDTAGPTAEVEILRGDLAGIIVEATKGSTDYVFGDRITALRETPANDQGGGSVTASFDHGEDRTADVVVAADGIGSSTRRLVFGGEPRIRQLGMYTAYLTIPRAETDSAWARWHNATGGRTMTLRPDNVGTTRATFSFLSEPQGYERLDPEAQKDVLRRKFADVGWEAPRILAALDGETDMYFEAIGQVHAPRWTHGRVALLGDAGYCASPISGMGTSLALVGAYVLAGELATHADHRDAFAAYERVMRPYVEKAQQLPPGAPRLANPKSRAGIALFNAALAVAANPVVSRIGGRFFSPPADEVSLPDYPAFAARA
ncbi:FAD-dependent monooxygenase [Plantibacter sp. YIM 135249]|uniref:FAD-dependent monooxygenase n=1 Tax=Plantibacter sp. YIM 135249 TaxID=3423918 RepID=UPI003D325215